MKKEKETAAAGASAAPVEEDFKGYTLEELRYQRALLLLKREFLKEKAVKETKAVKARIPMLNGKSPLASMSPQGILGRVAKGLNYADYLMLGFSIFSAGRKMFSLFRKKKK